MLLKDIISASYSCLVFVICLMQLHFSWLFLLTTHKSSVLSSSALRNVTSVDWLQCVLTCEEDAACVSYNYYRTERICELNDHGIKDSPTARSQLLVAQGVMFQQIKPIRRHQISMPEIKAQEFCVCNCGSGGQCVKKKKDKFVKPGKGDFANDTADSCSQIYNLRGAVPSRAYYIRTTSHPEFRHVYCHMTNIPGCGGGGWTLVMKINGSRSTFGFKSSYWTNKEEKDKNFSEDLKTRETKTATYWSTPFQKICLGMRHDGITRWMLLPHIGASLYEVISSNNAINTTIPISKWISLLKGALLQVNCSTQGFNIQRQAKVRIGIIGFASDTCSGVLHSSLGFGTSGDFGSLHADGPSTCGNEANNSGELVTKKAFGYILVQ